MYAPSRCAQGGGEGKQKKKKLDQRRTRHNDHDNDCGEKNNGTTTVARPRKVAWVQQVWSAERGDRTKKPESRVRVAT